MFSRSVKVSLRDGGSTPLTRLDTKDLDTEHGLLADGLLPFSVCQTVTREIWAAARAEAEALHRKQKRRTTTRLEVAQRR